MTSTDEVGILQRNFNAMIASLRTQYHTLEQQKAMLLTERSALEQALHDLQCTHERTKLQQQIIQAQRDTLHELSSPLLPIADKVVVMPLIGAIDTSRAAQILESLLRGVEQHRANVAIIDITGVQAVDASVAQVLLQAAQAITLLGAQTMLTGMRPQIAQTFVYLGIDMKNIRTFGTLQQGFLAAIKPQLATN
ncbi:MAG: STAS domain-containing protein [Chloroflexaceae bacterium]|nr:STAS domain-containing protein [Chloroflexaceae bacterium]